MKKIFAILIFLFIPAIASAQFFYSSPGGGAGDMSSAVYDPAGGAAQVAFASELIGDGAAVGQLLVWNGSSWVYVPELLWNDTSKYFGVGTANPRRRLDVLDATGPQFRLTHTDNSVFADFEIDSSGNLYINNTGANVAIGNSAGNGQSGEVAIGQMALDGNTGINGIGIGRYALQNNSGGYSAGIGPYSLQNNTGIYSNGFGMYALRSNIGIYSNGFGFSVLQNNVGSRSSGIGPYALQNNTGIYATGLGFQTLRYNQGTNNTAIGYNAWADFLTNTGGAKTFDYTDANATTDRITITGHGFGSNGTYINLLYTQGTSAITGLADATVYQVKIIDVNTVGFYEADGPGGASRGTNITNAGTGTGHTLTPQYTYANSIVIGNGINPTASNQINIGDVFYADTSLGNVGIGITSPTSRLHLPAGTATAGTAPIKLTSGTLLTSPEVGAFEFLTDDIYFSITTGSARKKVVLDDGTDLVSGDVPYVTTNGRLKSQTPVADGTYTMGKGTVTDGTITITNGIITAIQEASN
jgi:hypothetical protein